MAKKTNPDLIICGDIHAGLLTPECRKDVYIETLCRKLGFIKGLQEKYECPVIMPGDLFNHWRADSVLLNAIHPVWPSDVLAVAGQHDLPQHSIELIEKTALQTLVNYGQVQMIVSGTTIAPGLTLYGMPWEAPVPKPQPRGIKVLVAHVTIWEKPFMPGQKPGEASRFLKQHKDFDLIITGDNHCQFVIEDKGRLLVNAGSLMRLRSDQIDHIPRVYLWWRDGELKAVDIPIESDAVTREIRDAKLEREERVSAFVKKLEGSAEIGITFEENVKVLMENQKVDKNVRSIILECMGR